MRLHQSLVTLLTLLSPFTRAISRDGRADFDTVSIYGWPLNGEPKPIAIIKLDPITSSPLNRTASIFSYSPAKVQSAPSEIIRVGILEPTTKKWSGTAVSREAFNPSFDRKFVLYVDRASGRVWHVHLIATAIPPASKLTKKEKKKLEKAGRTKEAQRTKGETGVQVIVGGNGPVPVLNKPIVLNEDGKLDDADGVDNRSFLQKYWWAIAIFLVINLAAGGGGAES